MKKLMSMVKPAICIVFIVAFMLTSIVLGGRGRPGYDGSVDWVELEKESNSMMVKPSDDIVDKLNDLESEKYDVVMGDLTIDAWRVFYMSAGKYEVDPNTFIADTNYIEFYGLGADPNSTTIICAGGGVTFDIQAEHVRLTNLSIINTGSSGGDYALKLSVSGPGQAFKHLYCQSEAGKNKSPIYVRDDIEGDWNYIETAGEDAFLTPTGKSISGNFTNIKLNEGGFVATGAFDGTFEDIESLTSAFYGAPSGPLSGDFARIKVPDISMLGDGSGNFWNIETGDNCLTADFSGNIYNSKFGDNCVAFRNEFSGNAYNCVGDANCFGGDTCGGASNDDGIFSGNGYNLIASGCSFGGGRHDGGFSGYLSNCQLIDLPKSFNIQSGAEAEYCYIKSITAGQSGLTIDSDTVTPKIRYCTIICPSGEASIKGQSGEAKNVIVSHCTMNEAISGEITNFIETPYIVVDANVAD